MLSRITKMHQKRQVWSGKDEYTLIQISISILISHDFFCQKARIKTYLSYILSNQDERTIPIAQVFEILIRMVVKCCHEKSQKKIHRHGSFSCNCHCAQIENISSSLKVFNLLYCNSKYYGCLYILCLMKHFYEVFLVYLST